MVSSRWTRFATAVVMVFVSIAVAAQPAHANSSVLVQNCDRRDEQFRVNDDGSVSHRWQATPGSAWGAWYSMGGRTNYGQIDAFTNGDCKVEIFVTGTNYEVFTRWQNTANGTTGWHDWASIGGNFSWGPSSIDKFVNFEIVWGVRAQANGTGLFLCNWHTQPYGSPWTGWSVC